MDAGTLPRTLVVNFNAPELNHLAMALADAGALAGLVRPYANKGRLWERVLEGVPLAGTLYRSTLGRRGLGHAGLATLTHEAGVWPDMFAAVLSRVPALPVQWLQGRTSQLRMRVREAVSKAAGGRVEGVDCVVAYEGFALSAFEAARRRTGVSTVLNYPVAHHRHRRRVRSEEASREPAFAVTWPDFDDWPPGHEEQLDAEIEQADAVLVGSTYARETFLAEGMSDAKIRVVPYGVDLRTFHVGSERSASGPFNVIYTGQLTQRKGLSYLLRGYRKFARHDTRLTLVGNIVGSDRPLLPFADLVLHVAHQTRPMLAGSYRASDVFVLPTLVEGMPLVVLEAMACGLCVIVTANGPGDIVRDGIDGFIVPERDEDAICDRLDRLYRDPELRFEMGRNAARRAQEFSWGTYAANACGVLSGLAIRPRIA